MGVVSRGCIDSLSIVEQFVLVLENWTGMCTCNGVEYREWRILAVIPDGGMWKSKAVQRCLNVKKLLCYVGV